SRRRSRATSRTPCSRATRLSIAACSAKRAPSSRPSSARWRLSAMYGGTAQYLARHSLWRTFAGMLSGVLQVLGLVVLALIGAVLYVAMRWPVLTVLALLFWWLLRRWRRSRPRLAPISP